LDVSQRREFASDLNRQSGSFELALIPALFAAIGYVVDRWLGIVPVLTLVFLVVGALGVGVKIWLGYDREMREHEQNGPWAQNR
jgi:hypothetical protein